MGLRSPASNQVLFPLPPRSLKQESDGQNSKLNAVTKRQKDRGCVCCSVAKVKAKSLSRVRLCDPMDVAYQAPWSMGFSRQEYWSGLPFPSPGDLPNPGTKPGSPALQTDALLSEPLGKSHVQFFWDPMDCIARQAPLSMGFPWQEYSSGLPFPSTGNLPNPGMEPTSPALAGRCFTTEAPEKPVVGNYLCLSKR